MKLCDLQDDLYEFPYHYIPHFDQDGLPRITRALSWGIEYLTYMHVVKETIESLPGDSILDIGCGDGYLLNTMAKTELRKLGVDVSERPITFATAFSTDAEFRVQDIFEIDTQYDIVALTEVMEHIPDSQIDGFMEQAKSLVSPGGHIVITVPTTVVPLNKKHYRHYEETLLDEHIGNANTWSLVQEHRLYRHSKMLKRMLRLLHNKLWTINADFIWRRFWRWHESSNIYATTENGGHLLRVYRRNEVD